MVLFGFQFYPVCNFGKFTNFELSGKVKSVKVFVIVVQETSKRVATLLANGSGRQ